MKKQILLTILMLAAGSMSAQTYSQGEDQKVVEMRQKIGIDYTVPDYDVRKPDAKVMGWRLAKMLQKLEQNYQQGTYNRMLASIRSEILEDPNLRYTAVNKMKIQKIQKVGDVIAIRTILHPRMKPLVNSIMNLILSSIRELQTMIRPISFF